MDSKEGVAMRIAMSSFKGSFICRNKNQNVGLSYAPSAYYYSNGIVETVHIMQFMLLLLDPKGIYEK